MSSKDLVRLLQDLVPKETIDGQDIRELAKTCVMLDVAYKPVIKDVITQTDAELAYSVPFVIVDVREKTNGTYELRWKIEEQRDFDIVTADELAVMRARYITVLNYYRKNWHKITRPDQQAILNQYDIGFVPDPDSELGKMLHREV